MALLRIARTEVRQHGGAVPPGTGNAVASWSERRGLRLRVWDERDTVGEGEASPLPEYSPDTLDRARAVLGALPWSRMPAFDLDAPALPQIDRALALAHPDSPSALFAIETALLDLWGRRTGVPVHRLLAPGARLRPVPLAELLPGADPERTLAAARDAVSRGVGSLKLKIGRDPEAELSLLRRVRDAVGPGVELRADANGSLRPEGAADVLGALADRGVVLVEEPVPLALVDRIDAPAAVCIGADESLQVPKNGGRVRELTRRGRYGAWVLKPAALGGLGACLALAREARDLGAQVIPSHLFDGPIAMAAAAELALALAPEGAAGLAPHAGLHAWPRRTLASLRADRIVPHDAPGLGLSGAP